MEGINFNEVDSSTPIGQIIFLIAAIGVLLSSIKPFFPGDKNKSKVETWKDRAGRAERSEKVTRQVNRNLSEWQLLAREVIRILKNEVISLDGEIPKRVDSVEAKMDEIDEREVEYDDD